MRVGALYRAIVKVGFQHLAFDGFDGFRKLTVLAAPAFPADSKTDGLRLIVVLIVFERWWGRFHF